MSDAVLVRGEIPAPLFWSRIIIPLGIGGTVCIVMFGDRTVGIVLTALLGLLWIGLETYAALLRARQLWVRDTDDGFEVVDRKEAILIPDDSVSSVAIKTKRNYSGGELKSVFRQFIVWSDEVDDPITLETTLKVSKPDPLALLTTRLLSSVLERFKSQLKAGQAVTGDGWRLDANNLSWGTGAKQQSIPRRKITACEEFDGQICVWQKGQDDALARFPVNGRNVCLLPVLIESAEKSPDAAEEPENATGLGRILFERRPKRSTRVIAYMGGGLMLFVGLIMLIAGDEIGIKVGGLGVMAVGMLICIWAYSMAYSVFRCRERGVNKSGLFSQQEMRYVDVGTFTYSATRHYHNGVYCGTHVGMHFHPRHDLKVPKINYTTTVMNEDAALDDLRNYIGRAIAVRMAGRLAEGEAVEWTKNLTFMPDGIQYRPSGFVGRKEAKLLPYTEYGGQSMDQGVFYLFRKGDKKPVMNEQVSAPNFFPGFFLLAMMQQE